MEKKMFHYRDRMWTIPELASEAGVAYSTMQKRLQKMRVEDAVKMGRGIKKQPTLYTEYEGRRMSIKELAIKTKVDYGVLRHRIAVNGMTAEEAVKMPVRHWSSRKFDCPYPDCDACPYKDCVMP